MKAVSQDSLISSPPKAPSHDPFQRHLGKAPPPLTYTVALRVLQETLHAALLCLAVEGALGVLACEACLAVMCAQLTLVHIWHTEAWSQGLAG